ncbi:MAG: helix-turn-helix domain-containing protein, partial [Desulfobacteraceae bacterium]|nr:helix-turn-helix domain-containing protein [Desulfobacteraceae bacterium]
MTISKLARKMGISRNTLKRWIHFFKNTFPVSVQWKKIRGSVSSIVKNDCLPGNLINSYLKQQSNIEKALISCLKFLSQGGEISQKLRHG